MPILTGFLPSVASLPLMVIVAMVPLTEIVSTRFAAVTLTTGLETTEALVGAGLGLVIGFYDWGSALRWIRRWSRR